MKQPLTFEQAQAVFATMAALGHEIAFGWLHHEAMQEYLSNQEQSRGRGETGPGMKGRG